MDKRFFRNLLTKRSSAWTFGLCLTAVLVLGTIVAVDSAQRKEAGKPEIELEQAYLDESDPAFSTENPADEESGVGEAAQANAEGIADMGTAADGLDETVPSLADETEETGDMEAEVTAAAEEQPETAGEPAGASGEAADGTFQAQEASSPHVISEEALLEADVAFGETDTLLWPAAGTILIDYSMDGSVYFPTLDQYKYNPALVIGSETGNQVVSSAKGIVESLDVDEVTGLTMTVNIGNGYRLTYGQLKEAAANPGDLVEAGSVIGYVSEPTRFYSREGSNLYFQMSKDGAPVDPVLYLE